MARITVTRPEPTPPPAKVVLELEEHEAVALQGLLFGSSFYAVQEKLRDEYDLPDFHLNHLHGHLEYALQGAGVTSWRQLRGEIDEERYV